MKYQLIFKSKFFFSENKIRMNEFIIIITISIILFCLFIHYETIFTELIYIKSSINNKNYLVRNRKDKKKAANLLANISISLEKLVDYLNKKFPNDKRIIRLKKKFNSSNISESISGTKYTSYSVNKGEKIVFCLRSKDSKEKLVNLNTMLFVSIHELAHIMTLSVGHTDEFWENMKFLLKYAIKINIYKKQNFRKNPEPYCGTKITDSPLH